MMRLFIAIKLSDQQRKEIHHFQQDIKPFLEGVRWVPAENLHLTLKFLGEVSKDQLKAVQAAIDHSCADRESFQLIYGGCGVFPSPLKARVIWTGLLSGQDVVENIAEKIDNNLHRIGFSPEKRKFKAHLTLGRMRYPLDRTLIEKSISAGEQFKTSEALVDRVLLVESSLTRHGAVYRAIYEKIFRS